MSTRHYFTPFALALAFVAASGAAFAQTAPAPAAPTYAAPGAASAAQPGMGTAKRGHRLDRALATLGLSSDQQAKIRTYRESYRASQSTATPETRKALVAQIRSVLTPDQLARFKTAMQHRHAEPATAQ